ncbi:MAG: hypothetical protein U5N53_18515 [Mycobacterium sp.]|nr:hypothetical protein [Mycobacterium sp.]
MTSFATTPFPAGVQDADEDWGDYRLVFTPDFKVPGVDGLSIYASGYQLPDGTVATGDSAANAPMIWLADDVGLTAGQAKTLACLLGEIATLIDTWMGAA